MLATSFVGGARGGGQRGNIQGGGGLGIGNTFVQHACNEYAYCMHIEFALNIHEDNIGDRKCLHFDMLHFGAFGIFEFLKGTVNGFLVAFYLKVNLSKSR